MHQSRVGNLCSWQFEDRQSGKTFEVHRRQGRCRQIGRHRPSSVSSYLLHALHHALYAASATTAMTAAPSHATPRSRVQTLSERNHCPRGSPVGGRFRNPVLRFGLGSRHRPGAIGLLAVNEKLPGTGDCLRITNPTAQ